MSFNETITIINYAKDIDFEYQMKLYTIMFFLLFAIVFYFIDNNYLKNTTRASLKILTLGLKLFYWIIFLFSPLLVWQLARVAEVGFFILLQIYSYYSALVLMIIVVALYLLEEIFKWIGWEITTEGVKINVSKMEA